ncbi:MAG: serine acetyltransferase [Pseudarcicella sp.]|jgi:serine O-acetyltransferase|nr:serine acetyltransferase [Pseudarcicella sp.]MBP6411624.1 serine acetyltransferase [Pseudarcicella sp.]
MLSDDFLEHLCQKHAKAAIFPASSEVHKLFTKILLTLFPEQTQLHCTCSEDLKAIFESINNELAAMIASIKGFDESEAAVIAEKYVKQIPEIYRLLNTDICAIIAGDPAAQSEYEVIRAYPGFYAIAIFRLAHGLHQLDVPFLPRLLTEYAHSKTGIDIHPGANIGEYFFIDHGTGIVIGETTDIGKNVKIYQGVTLGALSVAKDMATKKRHPTIQDNVVIYAGATILGGDTIIGENAIIGGNVWLTKSLKPNSKIYHQENVKIFE